MPTFFDNLDTAEKIWLSFAIVCVIVIIAAIFYFIIKALTKKSSFNDASGEQKLQLQLGALSDPRSGRIASAFVSTPAAAIGRVEGLASIEAGAAAPAAANPTEGVALPMKVNEAYSYQEYLADVALDPATKKTHEQFVYDLPLRSSTASTNSERDDRIDVNSWVGLRRPYYQDPVAQNQPESRQVSSEDPDQMPKNQPFVII